jgi:hypothetical protein
MAGVNVQQRKWQRRGVKRFACKVQNRDGILTAAEQQRRPAKLRYGFANNVDRFRFKLIQMFG